VDVDALARGGPDDHGFHVQRYSVAEVARWGSLLWRLLRLRAWAKRWLCWPRPRCAADWCTTRRPEFDSSAYGACPFASGDPRMRAAAALPTEAVVRAAADAPRVVRYHFYEAVHPGRRYRIGALGPDHVAAGALGPLGSAGVRD
jgi:hypothetical protein